MNAPLRIVEPPQDDQPEVQPEAPFDLWESVYGVSRQDAMPGAGGIPFYKPSQTQRDYKSTDANAPVQNPRAQVRILCLWKKNDLATYQEIHRLISTGKAVLGSEDQRYDEEQKSWRVLIRYGPLWLEENHDI